MRRICLAIALAAMATAAMAQATGWMIQDKVSPLDGAKSYMAAVQSNEMLTDRWGHPLKATVGFICNSQGLSAAVVLPDFVESHMGLLDVAWKVDDGAVQQERWGATKLGGVVQGQVALTMLRTWSSAKRLVMRVQDRHGIEDVTFDIGGANVVYDTIASRGCG